MYFWRIEKLKSEMAAQPLSQRQVLPYLVLTLAAYTVVSYIPSDNFNFWDGVQALWSVFLTVAGAIYIYHCNGGANGKYFLQRYLAIGWVVGMRYLVLILIVGVGYFAALEYLRADISDHTSWYDFAFCAVFELIMYWRIAYHVGDLARRTSSELNGQSL